MTYIDIKYMILLYRFGRKTRSELVVAFALWQAGGSKI